MKDWPNFGDYVFVQMRVGDSFYHKVIGTLMSNAWVDSPVGYDKTAVFHEESELIANVVCCGVSEDEIYRVRVKDLVAAKPLK